jgi:rRNA maturation endonuclease Nob1
MGKAMPIRPPEFAMAMSVGKVIKPPKVATHRCEGCGARVKLSDGKCSYCGSDD